MGFQSLQISYLENRADGGFAWDVAFDLSLTGNVVEVDLRVQLVGDDPGALRQIWEKGINEIWNSRGLFAGADRLYEIKLDFDFVTSGAHQVVTVHDGYGRANMLNFYTETDWPADKQDDIAAHEIGHMLGLFDEYEGGATYNNQTSTGTLMSDLTLAGFEDYFWAIEYYVEYYSGLGLSTQLALRGTAGVDALDGTAGMDGAYGLAGSDTIRLRGANDLGFGQGGADTIFGGSGADRLNGGKGKDELWGGTGADRFIFDSVLNASTNVDRIEDFSVVADTILLDDAVFAALGALGRLADGAFRTGSAAGDWGDRVIYHRATGNLLYDADGSRAAVDAVRFAKLDAGLTLSAADFQIV